MGADFGQGLQGAAGGALAGGSIGGPWGAAIGGGLGGLLGLFGGNPQQQRQDELDAFGKRMGDMPAPQGTAVEAQGSPYEAQRGAFLNQLQAWANGTGPSAALGQMRMGMDQVRANQQGMAAGAQARGGTGQGGMQMQAANNTAAMQQQNNAQMGVVRSQEQMNAMNQYGQALGTATGQTMQQNQFNAGQQNDMARANLEARLRQLGITSDIQLRALLTALGSAQPGLGTQILAGGGGMFNTLAGGLAAHRGAPGGMPSGGNGGGTLGAPEQAGGFNGGLAPL